MRDGVPLKIYFLMQGLILNLKDDKSKVLTQFANLIMFEFLRNYVEWFTLKYGLVSSTYLQRYRPNRNYYNKHKGHARKDVRDNLFDMNGDKIHK